MGEEVKKKSINSRDKGCRGERQVAEIYRTRGFKARRGQQFCGGGNSPDVVVDDIPFVHHEVKWVKHLNLNMAYIQARQDAGVDKMPVVIHKVNSDQWKATMTFIDFISLLQWAIGRVDPLNTLARHLKPYHNSGRREFFRRNIRKEENARQQQAIKDDERSRKKANSAHLIPSDGSLL